MAIPKPEPGLVISYAYLWRSEYEAGQDEGVKDRPCAIIVAISNEDSEDVVIVCPITHTPPESIEDAIEIPQATKRRLGLDDEPSWVIASEVNRFVWPGPDLRRTHSGSFEYGFLPKKLYEQIRSKVLELKRCNKLKAVTRTD